MESHFFDTMSQWFMYLLPTIAMYIRKRMGKPLLFTMGFTFFFNLFLGWTIVAWILLMLAAFGINPIAWLAPKLATMLTPLAGGAGMPQPAGDGSAGPGICSQCGGSRQIMCSQCQGRGSWYSQPTGEHGVAQLQTCGTCMSSGRIQCPYGPHA